MDRAEARLTALAKTAVLDALPSVLREAAAEGLARLGRALPAKGALRDAVARTFAASPFATDVLTRDPARFAALAKAGAFEAPHKPGALAGAFREALGESDEAAFMAALRRTRNEALARIALRDVAGWATLPETLTALSDLADAAIQAALARGQSALRERYGEPRDERKRPSRPYVLGMGKLGGGELNFSSDVDLIFCYAAPGETDGRDPLPNEQYYEKLVQLVTRYLAQPTADGFAYRVDWMLRPFGRSGPPAMHTAAMEEYYQSHGREWERYAFIKARVVAGDREAGAQLLATLRPFVYRRYLDYNAIGALRGLKRTIEAEVARKEMHANLKLGDGGIREVEFIAQAFQLTRGGQEAALRDARLRPVLRHLGEAGYLAPETAAALDEAYLFLRRVENGVQMYRDQQTHDLPEGDEARAALTVALELPDWAALERRLGEVRARVSAEFRRVFAAPKGEAAASRSAATLRLIWGGGLEGGAADAALAQLGFGDEAGAVAEELRALRASHLVRALSDATFARLESLAAAVLDEALAQSSPATVARRVLDVLGAIAGRATYLTLLLESRPARAQLLRLCAASPWLTELLAQSPALLDNLIDERTLYAPPEREEMRAELEERFADVAPGDTEGAMNALRMFRKEMMLRVAASDLVQALPLVKVSDRLTWLAEVILEKTLALNRAELTQQYGTPRRADGAPVQFAVVAYGKFAGLEMGYGSDLDVVFLHDCDALQAEATGGVKPLANEVWLARLAQRIIHWLSTQTSAGRVYEVDLELRPDGRRGLTVSAFGSFAQYQRESAWTWEHQALTRARPVAGDAGLRQDFLNLRRDVLTRPRDSDRLRHDVAGMRAKMRAHLDRSQPGLFDVKQGEGGLTDIEFLTQYLVLRHAHEHPALVDWPDNWRQTDALVAAGVLGAEQARALIESYRQFRAYLHAQDLQQSKQLADDSAFEAARAAVRAVWRAFLGEAA